MKKFISLFAALAITASALPTVSAFAEDNKTAVTHQEKTVTIGDVNNSGKIDIGDLVTASKFFLGEDVDKISSMLLDVNFDGENDIFDLIELRKLLISPENSKIQEYVMDMVKSQIKMNSDNIKLENAADAAAYFKKILSDSEEIKKFTDLYDEEFFKDNVLILRSFLQGDTDSLVFDFAENGYNSLKKCLELDLDNILDDAKAEKADLNGDFGCVLTQISIPKEMSDMIDGISLLSDMTGDLPYFESFMKVLSPDGLQEILVKDDEELMRLILENDGKPFNTNWGLDENTDIDLFDLLNNANLSEDELNKALADLSGNNNPFGDLLSCKELLDIE